MEIQKPTADPATLRADGDLMKETPIQSLCPVQGQPLLQCLGAQVLVLHGQLLLWK
jgi:hypothetical protein